MDTIRDITATAGQEYWIMMHLMHYTERGIFDRETANSFRENILAKNGTKDAMEMYVAFRGREPKIDSYLRNHGIIIRMFRNRSLYISLLAIYCVLQACAVVERSRILQILFIFLQMIWDMENWEYTGRQK